MDEDKIALGGDVQNEADNEMSRKKIRHRKKQFYQTIRKQMEFYFSDANVAKDRFLGKLIYKDPRVDLSIFLRFNRIRALTTDIRDIANALRYSELLSVTEDGTKVLRKTPVKEKENTEECTIYVEQLPPDAQHDWLTEVFSAYGKVSYVSIPKFRNSGKIKGFAFVEFETPEDANKTLEAFGAMGCCLSSQYAPEKLCSIATYEPPESELESKSDVITVKEEKLDEDESHLDKITKKRRKRKKEKLDSSYETNEVEPAEVKVEPAEVKVEPAEVKVEPAEVKEEDSSSKKHKIQESESEGVKSDQAVDDDAPPLKKIKTETSETKGVKKDADLSGTKKLKNTENDDKRNNTDVDRSLESEDPESNEMQSKKRKRKRISENEVELENKSKRPEADVSEIPDSAEMKIRKKRKKKTVEGGGEEEEALELKQSTSENENNEEVGAQLKTTSLDCSMGDLSEPNAEEAAGEEGEEIAVKKKNRKRKKKHKKSDKQDVEAGRLKILPKREWKRLRNKYLDLQKAKMKCLKQYLRNKWNSNSQIMYHHDQSHSTNGQSEEKEGQEGATSEIEAAITPRFTFIPGVVVRITLDEPVMDLRKFKADVKVHGDVKYVDVMLGTTEAFVRFGTATASEQFVSTAPWKQVEILKGEEESLYWEKMSQDRDQKFSNNIRVKRRGRDKILRRAERELGKHIRFDE